MAWDVFGEANGAACVEELRVRLSRLSPSPGPFELDRQIGCIAIAFPTFFAPDDWVPLPPDWKHNIVSGRTYDLSTGRDLHRLFDLGYVTVRPDRTFAVSRRLREDYANGQVYYELEGRSIAVPANPEERPATELLEWHNDVVFRG